MKKIEKQVKSYLYYCERVRRMSETTINFKEYVINEFIRVSRLGDLRRLNNKTFDKWVSYEMRKGVSARSVNTYKAIVLAMVRYFEDTGMKVPLNFKLVQSLNEGELTRKFYTKEDIEKVIRYADLMTELMIRIMFETGMRIAELTRLRVSNFEGRKVKFIGKGRKAREADISEETHNALEIFIGNYNIRDYLWGFQAMNGEPPTTNTIRNRLKTAFGEAGFEGFYPHALRHSVATNLQIKGASVVEIKEMMGHESIATTERYLHGFDGRLEELFEKYR